MCTGRSATSFQVIKRCLIIPALPPSLTTIPKYPPGHPSIPGCLAVSAVKDVCFCACNAAIHPFPHRRRMWPGPTFPGAESSTAASSASSRCCCCPTSSTIKTHTVIAAKDQRQQCNLQCNPSPTASLPLQWFASCPHRRVSSHLATCPGPDRLRHVRRRRRPQRRERPERAVEPACVGRQVQVQVCGLLHARPHARPASPAALPMVGKEHWRPPYKPRRANHRLQTAPVSTYTYTYKHFRRASV